MHLLDGDWKTKGYALLDDLDAREQMEYLRDTFTTNFKARFSHDAKRNRALIKLFAEDVSVKSLFSRSIIIKALQFVGLELPVHTGPIVTHYTANDSTSGSYGLPFHQDWPSMATSQRGVIVWTTIQEIDSNTHGLTLVPGSHVHGILPGRQTDNGYIVNPEELGTAMDVAALPGQILLMSPYLVHRTRVHDSCGDWKLSLSARFDDLACQFWDQRDYVSAYKTTVDRNAYLS